MQIKELEKKAIVNLMAHYAAKWSREAGVDEVVAYHKDECCCSFRKEEDVATNDDVFFVPIYDLIANGGLYIHPNSERWCPDIRVNDVDKIVDVIEDYYKD